MLWRVNLVTIALTLCCTTCALEMIDSYNTSSQVNDTDAIKYRNTLIQTAMKNVQGSKQEELDRGYTDEPSSTALQPAMKIQYSSLDQSRRIKRKKDGMLMALLMAYKMKFVALIPTLVGGTILLISTATLAGFFFALFAAVLGLKIR